MSGAVYLIESLRTPQGSLGGTLADVAAPQLAAAVIRGLLERSGLPADAVDEVIVGQVLAGGSGQAPARQAMRAAGLPDAIPALTINKVCGSGLKALMLGAGSIRLGDAAIVIAGGMENMSQAPFLLKQARYGYRMGSGELLDLMIQDGLLDPYSNQHMGVIAEASTEKPTPQAQAAEPEKEQAAAPAQNQGSNQPAKSQAPAAVQSRPSGEQDGHKKKRKRH